MLRISHVSCLRVHDMFVEKVLFCCFCSCMPMSFLCFLSVPRLHKNSAGLQETPHVVFLHCQLSDVCSFPSRFISKAPNVQVPGVISQPPAGAHHTLTQLITIFVEQHCFLNMFRCISLLHEHHLMFFQESEIPKFNHPKIQQEIIKIPTVCPPNAM